MGLAVVVQLHQLREVVVHNLRREHWGLANQGLMRRGEGEGEGHTAAKGKQKTHDGAATSVKVCGAAAAHLHR